LPLDEGGRWEERLTQWEALYKREKEEKFAMIKDWYGNKFPPGLLTVNLLFSFGRSVVPQLYFKNPVSSVTIKRPGFGDAQMTLQTVDDRLMQLMRLKETMKKMIVSAFCFSRGVVKVGYVDEVDNLGMTQSGMLPHYRRQDRLSPGRPYVAHFQTKDFAFDSDVSDIDDSAWFAMKFDRSHGQLKEDEGPLGTYMKDKLSEDDDEMEPFWEVWDKYTGKFHIQHEKDLVEDPQDFEVWPFYKLDFNWVPEMPLGVSDAELILDLQKEYNEIKTQIHQHRRISLVKLLARKGALDQEAKAALKDGEVGPVVEVEGAVGESITPFAPQIPTDLFTTANTNEQDVRAVIGFSRNQLGETGPSKKTASEANIIQQQIMIRLDERRDMCADVIGDVLHAVNSIILERWAPETAVDYGAEQTAWAKLVSVKDTYTVTIVPDSTLPLSRQVKQAEAKEMYVTLRDDPLIDPLRLRLKLLEAFETADLSLINQQAVAQLQAVQSQLAGQGQAIEQGRQKRGPDQTQRQPRSVA